LLTIKSSGGTAAEGDSVFSEITYNGNLCVIINERTACTSEPIVHGLKASGLG